MVIFSPVLATTNKAAVNTVIQVSLFDIYFSWATARGNIAVYNMLIFLVL